MPLSAHSVANQPSVEPHLRTSTIRDSLRGTQGQSHSCPNAEPHPNSTLTHAVRASPVESMMLGESTSPTTPETNLEHPYVCGKTLVITPIAVMSSPRAGEATMAGAV